MLQPIAIQSWCYRHWKQLPDVLTQLRNTGVSAIELCGAHVNFDDPSTFDTAIQQCRQAGVKIVAIGVELMTGKIDRDRKRFEFCKAAGMKNISITFGPEAMFDALRVVEKLADEYDVNCGIHNHGGYDWLGNSVILKFIFSRTSKRIGLHLDTAWAIDAKQDPIKMAEQFADRLHGVHVKDFIYNRARQFEDVIIGTGNLDLPKFVGTLKQINFTGPLVVEYEADVENPVPALKGCVEALQRTLQ